MQWRGAGKCTPVGSLPQSLGATECRREAERAKTDPKGPEAPKKIKEKEGCGLEKAGQESGGGSGPGLEGLGRNSPFQFLPTEPALQASSALSWKRREQAQLLKPGQDRCQCRPKALLGRRVTGFRKQGADGDSVHELCGCSSWADSVSRPCSCPLTTPTFCALNPKAGGSCA